MASDAPISEPSDWRIRWDGQSYRCTIDGAGPFESVTQYERHEAAEHDHATGRPYRGPGRMRRPGEQ